MANKNLTNKSQELLAAASSAAAQLQHQIVEPSHLLAAMLADTQSLAHTLLKKIGTNIAELQTQNNAQLAELPRVNNANADPYASKTLAEVYKKANSTATNLKDDYISVEHLLLALTQVPSPAQSLLASGNVTKDTVLQALQTVRGNNRVTNKNPEDKYNALQQYSRNLNKEVISGKVDPVIGRDAEIRRVMQVLARRTKNNPVLIGEPGVGKTAIVEGIAQRVVDGDVPEILQHKTLVALDLAALIAGASQRGQFEDRLKAVIKAVAESAGEIVLFIDELHTLVGAGALPGSLDAANILKPALARGDLHCIGATTLGEYQKYIEKDPALDRRFQRVLIEEPNIENTVSILRGISEKYEVHHGVRIKDAALVAAAELSSRYITDKFLPDKAIDLIDEAASNLRIQLDSVPAEIDNIKRRITQLEIEKQALLREM